MICARFLPLGRELLLEEPLSAPLGQWDLLVPTGLGVTRTWPFGVPPALPCSVPGCPNRLPVSNLNVTCVFVYPGIFSLN